MKPLAWQPGTAMRFDEIIFASNSADSSGKPYAQPGAVRWAGRSVEDHRIFILHQLRRFYRRGVGQAEEGDIRRVQRLAPRLSILSLLLG